MFFSLTLHGNLSWKLPFYTDLAFKPDRLPSSYLSSEHTLRGLRTMFEIHNSWSTNHIVASGLLNLFCKLWNVPVLYDKFQMSLFSGLTWSTQGSSWSNRYTISLVPSLTSQHFKSDKYIYCHKKKKVPASRSGCSNQENQRENTHISLPLRVLTCLHSHSLHSSTQASPFQRPPFGLQGPGVDTKTIAL